MRTWLFAWEFGQGLGHLRRLGRLAAALVAPGERCVVASETIPPADVFPSGAEMAVLPAFPTPSAPRPKPGFLPTYAAGLAQLGFQDAGHIALRLAAWDDLFAKIQPSVVIADHAPFAVLAAQGRIAAAVLGSGLDLPPVDGERFPNALPGGAPIDEAPILAAIARAGLVSRRQPPASLPQAVGGTLRILVGLPAFDPYRDRRLELHLGPLGPRPALSPAPSQANIFAYLRSDEPSFDPLVMALAKAGLPATVHWQGPPAPWAADLLRGRGATVLDQPADIGPALAQASLVVSLGGAGLTADAVFAGRPQLVFPIHLESTFAALGLEALGAGQRLSIRGLATQIEAAADELALRDGAMRAGMDAHANFGADPAPTVAEQVRSLA